MKLDGKSSLVMSTASDWLQSTRSLAEGAPSLVGQWLPGAPLIHTGAVIKVPQGKARSVSIGIWEGAKFR
jgi:hypothetical protein